MDERPLRDRRVLVVEDDYFIAIGAQREMEAAGAIVIGPVPSVEAALARVAAEPRLDGAILDLGLGGELSYPVADALAARGVPFVFATGYGEAAIVAAYADVPRCEKPIDYHHLKQVLAERMSASSSVDADAGELR